MSRQHLHVLPTIVALSQTVKEPGAPRYLSHRKTDPSSSSKISGSSGTTLISLQETKPHLPTMLIRQMHAEPSNEFSNTPPMSPIHGLDCAYFGMAYSQRYQRQTYDSKRGSTSTIRAEPHTYHYPERRARNVQLETERFPLIAKAAQKMADIFNIKKPAFFDPLVPERNDVLGGNSIGRLSNYAPSSDQILIKRRHLPSQERSTRTHAATRSGRGPFVVNTDLDCAQREHTASHDKSCGVEFPNKADSLIYRRRSISISSCTLVIKGCSSVHQKRRP
ncbi:hypothetical protein J3B02_006259, partial [Coemansia erecta]